MADFSDLGAALPQGNYAQLAGAPVQAVAPGDYAQPSGGPLQFNLSAADAALKLTPQEKALYQMHMRNLVGPGGVDHPNGDRSTLYQAVQEHGGRFYNIPTVWGGKIEAEPYKTSRGEMMDVPNATALANVEKLGWNNFPSYASPTEADARYDAMHHYMDRDTSMFLASRKR